ncbi:hypothetical protein PVAG01_04458 [Phlyctema vagabunda]|uniref:Uncharacterized protein n=1 Tax=Phlyctema vagabunda TaxID=108571 RepID=A0ABR4PPB8_9HELO
MIYLTAFALPFILLVLGIFQKLKLRHVHRNAGLLPNRFGGRNEQEKVSSPKDSGVFRGSKSQLCELDALKRMYHQLQNLEEFPEVVPEARRLLDSLIQDTGREGKEDPEGSVSNIDQFSREKLQDFMAARDQTVTQKWKEYITRRQNGGPRELFADLPEAEWWLRQIAPVKLIDGAWLGHIYRVTLPFGLLGVIRSAWQVLSEELGDGDLRKNHAYIYSELLRSFDCNLPPSYDTEFIGERQKLDEISVWKAAVAQLLICLFPHDLLPEILGFNLHFEAISLETLLATKELKEVGLDPYYFILHVSIDNSDCGHTAIAFEAVCRYVEYVRSVEGEHAAHEAWRRVQSGYLLSSALPPTTICPSQRDKKRIPSFKSVTAEQEMIRIFKAKARAGHGLHASSLCKIGRRKLVEWLDPVALESEQWQADLLHDLSNSKYWISRGDSDNSRFIQELVWGGRMFGCFTTVECEVVKNWIDSLHLPQEANTGLFVNAGEGGSDILTKYPVFQEAYTSTTQWNIEHMVPRLITFDTLEPLPINSEPIPELFIPLWMSHTCLLQNFVSVPSRTTNPSTCAIVKILRAQAGFGVEQSCVAGLDEVKRLGSSPRTLGIVGFGLILMNQWKLGAAYSLGDVFRIWPSNFAVDMLHLSMHHIKNRDLLIGMATAFFQLHDIMSRSEIFSTKDQILLRDISRREADGLRICWNDLYNYNDETTYNKCCYGYSVARTEILRCFSRAEGHDTKAMSL